MNLYHLVYSSSRKPNCDESEIQKILDACKRNNPKRNITGILLHSENQFIQYIEGPKEIIGLYDEIKEDPRHTKVIMLSYMPIKERLFPSWHMGFKDISKNKLEFHTEGNAQEKELFEAIIKGEKQEVFSAVNLLAKFFNKQAA